MLRWAGINQLSIREAAEQLKECGYTVPSGDALLERLSKQPYEVLEDGFDDVIAELLGRARQQQLFMHPVIVAIDFTDIEYYGEEVPFIVTSQSKNGTNQFIRFATICGRGRWETVYPEGAAGDAIVEHGRCCPGVANVCPAAG